MLNLVTRFPNGLGNVLETDPMSDYKAPALSKYHDWFDDFDTYLSTQWTLTEVGAAGTQAVIAGDGGILSFVTDVLDNDGAQLQWAQETFRWTSGKDMVIDCIFSASDITQSDVLIGLAITDTTLIASLPTDGIYFLKPDDATAIIFSVRKDGVSTSAALGSIVAGYNRVTAQYSSATGEWYAYLNGVAAGRIAAGVTTNPDDEDLAVSIAVQNGSAGAKTFNFDRLQISKER